MKRRLSPIYFSLKQLIEPNEKDISLKGLSITFVPPIIISFFLCFFIETNYLEIVNIYALFTALLIIWPSILYSRELLSYQVYNKRKSLYFIYINFIYLYYLASIAGYRVYTYILDIDISINFNILSFLNFYENLHPFYQGLISDAIWVLLAAIATYIYRKLSKSLNRSLKKERISYE
jgi:hypothetical protein